MKEMGKRQNKVNIWKSDINKQKEKVKCKSKWWNGSKAKWRDMVYWLKLKWNKDNLMQMVKEKKQVEKEN